MAGVIVQSVVWVGPSVGRSGLRIAQVKTSLPLSAPKAKEDDENRKWATG